jgi:hypothetical protein
MVEKYAPAALLGGDRRGGYPPGINQASPRHQLGIISACEQVGCMFDVMCKVLIYLLLWMFWGGWRRDGMGVEGLKTGKTGLRWDQKRAEKGDMR